MSFTKKFGKLILVTLCISTILFIYKSGFEEAECDLSNSPVASIRQLLTKAEKDQWCQSIAIQNLAGSGVQNALDYLTNQSNALLASGVGAYLGLTEDPASVVIILF